MMKFDLSAGRPTTAPSTEPGGDGRSRMIARQLKELMGKHGELQRSFQTMTESKTQLETRLSKANLVTQEQDGLIRLLQNRIALLEQQGSGSKAPSRPSSAHPASRSIFNGGASSSNNSSDGSVMARPSSANIRSLSSNSILALKGAVDSAAYAHPPLEKSPAIVMPPRPQSAKYPMRQTYLMTLPTEKMPVNL